VKNSTLASCPPIQAIEPEARAHSGRPILLSRALKPVWDLSLLHFGSTPR
jgi:hypothetical protein